MAIPVDLPVFDELEAVGFTRPPGHAVAVLNGSARDNAGTVSGFVTVKTETYRQEEISPADDSGITLASCSMAEEFFGGITGNGVATHIHVARADGTNTFTGIERITGTLAGRSGSFVITDAGYYDRYGMVHGRWSTVVGSGTGELVGLRATGDFTVAIATKSGPMSTYTASYWFEEDLAEAQERLADVQIPGKSTPSLSVFDEAYKSHTAPWVIGEPQPAIVALERDGWIRGTVLDPGCGTGEHTIHLARLGYDVRGIDFSENAIEQARVKAAEYKVAARFEVADALHLGDQPKYDTVVDSALFHIFGPRDRAQYVRSLHLACRPDALVHILALSDAGPGFGPQISDTVIREAFGEGWVLEDLRSSHYRGVVGSEHAAELGLPAGDLIDLPAWLARVRRI